MSNLIRKISASALCVAVALPLSVATGFAQENDGMVQPAYCRPGPDGTGCYTPPPASAGFFIEFERFAPTNDTYRLWEINKVVRQYGFEATQLQESVWGPRLVVDLGYLDKETTEEIERALDALPSIKDAEPNWINYAL